MLKTEFIPNEISLSILGRREIDSSFRKKFWICRLWKTFGEEIISQEEEKSTNECSEQ